MVVGAATLADVAGPSPANQVSFSRVKSFYQCPAAYRYRYLKGFEAAFRSLESFVGSVVHEVLEWLYRRRDDGSSPTLAVTLAELEQRFTAGWGDDVAIVRAGHRREDALADAVAMVERFHRATFARDRSETVALESRLTLELAPGIHFTGFADRIGRSDRGTLFVVDYKTAKSVGDRSDPFSEGLQAPLYAACAMTRGDDAEANAGYHYLRHGVTSWHRVDRDQAQSLIERFAALAAEVRAAQDFPARPGVLCAWCGFNAICPAASVGFGLEGGLVRARAVLGEQLDSG